MPPEAAPDAIHEESPRPPPWAAGIDHAAALLRAPYDHLRGLLDAGGSDVVDLRLLGRTTTCLRGEEAARLLYDEARFARAGAMPEPIRATLTGKGGVQGLDGAAHRRRKALFLAALAPGRVEALAEAFEPALRDGLRRAAAAGPVPLYEALHPILAASACAWAGVPLPAGDVARRTRDLVLMFDRAAALGPGHLRARLARRRAEGWGARLVRAARRGRPAAPEGSALRLVAAHEEEGRALPPRVAAVELLNLLRPTVAVSVFIAHMARALLLHPEAAPGPGATRAERLRFLQEVRRLAPFFPVVAAVARGPVEWRGVAIPAGRRCLLDLHATNRDPRLWPDPDAFDPSRFAGREPGRFDLVPQGGGDAATGHRCPGEGVALALMDRALVVLTGTPGLRLAAPGLGLDRGRLPALPAPPVTVGLAPP